LSSDEAKDGFITTPLGKHHDRAAFSSDAPELDRYLQQQAQQDARRNIAAPFVICEAGTSSVIGYYTLSATSAALGELPDETAHKLPHYPDVPAFLLGRLAVHNAWHGHGLGKRLLIDALYRCWDLKARVAAALILVDARDDAAADFYAHFGFMRLPDQSYRLFLPMKTVNDLVG